MFNLFNTVIEMSIKAAVVILLILVVRLFLRKVPKKFSYLLWAVAAFRLCIPYSFKALFSVFSIGGKTSVGEQISQSVDRIPNFVPNLNAGAPVINGGTASVPNIDIPQSGIGNVGNLGGIDNMGEVGATVADKGIDWGVLLMQIALVTWIIGFAAMVIYGAVTYIKTYRKMQNAVLVRENVYFSDRIDAPFSMGFIKPKIYLPFGFSDSEQECVIAHEKCHIKRFDHIVKLFSYLLLCVHWFNPMCWVAFNRMTYDMETSCDEMVFANGITEEKKKQYSHTLVSVGTKKRFPAPAPINFDGISNTKSRIKHILKLKKTSVWIKIICFVLCAVVLIACAADVKQSATEDEADLIADALDSKIKVFGENGEEGFIKDMGYDYTMQAYVDMDGDGKQEAVLELSDYIGYIILREYNGDVYAYEKVYRGLKSLKTDGSYLGSSGAAYNGIYRMSFEGTKFVETELALCDEMDEVYRIDGKEVSLDECTEYFTNWNNKEDVIFAIKYKYSVVVTQLNGKQYTAAVGFEADKAYLDITGADSKYRLNLDIYDKDNIGNAAMQPYAVDVTFDGNIDILVPYMNTNAAMYYSAFVWDDGTQRFKYVPNFEKIPNFVLDNEKARILAHRQGDMENYYAYCRFNGDEFITTNCVFFKCVDPDNYKYEITESQYDNGALNDVAKYTVTGTEYYSVKGISAELDKYYELGSFWELDSGKWGTLNNAPAVAISTPSEKLLESGNYSTYIDEVLISDTLMFKANTDVIDFKFITVEYSEDLGTYSKGEILYSQPELTASGKPIVIYTQIDELISNRGIMFSYSSGGTEIYAIAYDMRNGGYYLKRISDNNELIGDKVDIAFEIGAATEEMINSDDYIYFVDNTDQYGYKNAQLYIKPNSKLKEFKFIELDESEALRVGEVLYEVPLLYEKPFVFFTYINDVTYNRGFSYVDENGKEKYFAFCCDMSGESDLPFGVVDVTDHVGVNETAEINVAKGVAFRFADAYLYNDIETARALMDSPSNECLEYFENDTNQYNSIECGEMVVTGKVSNDAGILSVVHLEIPFYETREGYEGVTYMLMTLVKQDGDWRVTFFDFDA